jgi:hypothetical protein
VLQQVELRRKARAKFAEADGMFFTPIGLEQATDQWVARYKASRFPNGEPVADLCCGIGGDLVALAQRGPAVGVERDPITALLAEANLRVLDLGAGGHPAAEVRVEDVAQFSVSELAAWHLDPDRRGEGRRTIRIEHHQPGLSTIRRLLHQRADAAVKLAPATDPPEAWTQRAELEWISRRRQCRQLVVWFGRLARNPGRRCATVLDSYESTLAQNGKKYSDDLHGSGSSGLGGEESDHPGPIRTVVGTPETRAPIVDRVGRYVFDPDPAVVAARLLGTLAAEHDLAALGPGAAYLTGPRPLADPALGCFEVTDVLPLDLRRLKQLLRGRDVGRLEIKKRGVSHDLEALRHRLHVRGDQSAVLLVAPVGRTVTAILARRANPRSA